ncbi:2-C-methyl-D-erythritol 2,4-cyclodiphosphate synthase [Rubellimicrobium thermophilum DSM 16684]|uniref:Bifunctional enzyme IspD/IspF n=1 Tax=Rubellimicrobium thermophilum DSM 16684 TaxID=1123069 RepID=S9QXT5_9RHOB|nr:bifunctional 2-C-methyl-D-erythritol 4-phosphate cytidylyltransferase/2-C-methyl-D-erythritol 2,4-cyclodiphosphate synthase [Rubellimicrobium thermophilum]EPX86166.1 2-C-methyl-D-erythritol 2,4-cyclodiphosphate synthase [Rubellimicrobium thermophilum DSM 16684]
MELAGVIVAAGRGSRLGGRPKQWRLVNGLPLAGHALHAFRQAGIARLVLVIHPDDRAEAERLMQPGLLIVHGAESRSGSVRAGLEALAPTPPEAVLIHDAARPCVSAALIRRVIEALDRADGAAPALPVTDALWRSSGSFVEAAHPRDGLWRAQTPQGFRFGPILSAHQAHAGEAADDVEVARAAGLSVALVPGEEDNFKVTLPGDLERAARILGEEMEVRTGHGYDVHAFGPGDHVMLCGVRIPHERGLSAHSDGDAALHALTDAILGALCLGDIGQHFSPSDPRWKDEDSTTFLRHAHGLAREAGFRIGHCDITIICEAPRIAPHVAAMRERIGAVLALSPDRISVKATTSERLGFTGRREGIAAFATATLVRP